MLTVLLPGVRPALRENSHVGDCELFGQSGQARELIQTRGNTASVVWCVFMAVHTLHASQCHHPAPGFRTFQQHSNVNVKCKKEFGGTALVSEKCCSVSRVTVKEHFCSLDIELLTSNFNHYSLKSVWMKWCKVITWLAVLNRCGYLTELTTLLVDTQLKAEDHLFQLKSHKNRYRNDVSKYFCLVILFLSCFSCFYWCNKAIFLLLAWLKDFLSCLAVS